MATESAQHERPRESQGKWNERINRAAGEDGMNTCMHGRLSPTRCIRCYDEQNAEITRLRTELAEARKDALRYRWLREFDNIQTITVWDNIEGAFGGLLDGLDLDDHIDELMAPAIDTAMAKTP